MRRLHEVHRLGLHSSTCKIGRLSPGVRLLCRLAVIQCDCPHCGPAWSDLHADWRRHLLRVLEERPAAACVLLHGRRHAMQRRHHVMCLPCTMREHVPERRGLPIKTSA